MFIACTDNFDHEKGEGGKDEMGWNSHHGVKDQWQPSSQLDTCFIDLVRYICRDL